MTDTDGAEHSAPSLLVGYVGCFEHEDCPRLLVIA